MDAFKTIPKKDLFAKYKPVKKIAKQKWRFKPSISCIVKRETSDTGKVSYCVKLLNNEIAYISANRLRKSYYQLMEDFEMEYFKASEIESSTQRPKRLHNSTLPNKPVSNKRKKLQPMSKDKQQETNIAIQASKIKHQENNLLRFAVTNQEKINSNAESTNQQESTNKVSESIVQTDQQKNSDKNLNFTIAHGSLQTKQQGPNNIINSVSLRTDNQTTTSLTKPQVSSKANQSKTSTQDHSQINQNKISLTIKQIKISLDQQRNGITRVPSPTTVPHNAVQTTSNKPKRIQLSLKSNQNDFYAVANTNATKQHAQNCSECNKPGYTSSVKNDAPSIQTNPSCLVLCQRCPFACHLVCLKEKSIFDLSKFLCPNCAPLLECIGCKRHVVSKKTDGETHPKCLDCTRYGDLQVENILALRKEKSEVLIKWKGKSFRHVSWIPFDWTQKMWKNKLFVYETTYGLKDTTSKDGRFFPVEWTKVERILKVRWEGQKVTKIFAVYQDTNYKDVLWDDPPTEDETELYKAYKHALDRYLLSTKVVVPFHDLEKKISDIRCQPVLQFTKQPDCINGGTLMKHQIEGLNWILLNWKKHQTCILADDEGLGKTVQAIAFMYIFFKKYQVFPFLVVVPNNSIAFWIQELEKWAPDMVSVPYYNDNESRRIALEHEIFGKNLELKCHVVVATFESIQSSSMLQHIIWSAVIVDEPPNLKQMEPLLSVSLGTYKKDALIILTSKVPPETRNDQLSSHVKDESNLITNVLQPYTLSRTREDLLKTIPPKHEIIMPISMTPLQKHLYQNNLHTSDREINIRKIANHPYLLDTVGTTQSTPKQAHHNLVQVCGKLKLFDQILPKWRAQKNRVVVSCTMTDALDLIDRYLTYLDVKFVRLYGSKKECTRAADLFNAPNSEIEIALLPRNTKVYLATADTILFWDDNLKDMYALDCVHCIGQENTVFVCRFMTHFPNEKNESSTNKISNGDIVYTSKALDGFLDRKKLKTAQKNSLNVENDPMNTTTGTQEKVEKTLDEEGECGEKKNAEKNQELSENQEDSKKEIQTILFGKITGDSSSKTVDLKRNDFTSKIAALKLKPAAFTNISETSTVIGDTIENPIDLSDSEEQETQGHEQNQRVFSEPPSNTASKLFDKLNTSMIKVVSRYCIDTRKYLIDCGKMGISKEIYDDKISRGIDDVFSKNAVEFESQLAKDTTYLEYSGSFDSVFEEARAAVMIQFANWKAHNENILIKMGKEQRQKQTVKHQPVNTPTNSQIHPPSSVQSTVSLSVHTSTVQPISSVSLEEEQDISIVSSDEEFLTADSSPATSFQEETYTADSPSNVSLVDEPITANLTTGLWDDQIEQSRSILANILSSHALKPQIVQNTPLEQPPQTVQESIQDIQSNPEPGYRKYTQTLQPSIQPILTKLSNGRLSKKIKSTKNKFKEGTSSASIRIPQRPEQKFTPEELKAKILKSRQAKLEGVKKVLAEIASKQKLNQNDFSPK